MIRPPNVQFYFGIIDSAFVILPSLAVSYGSCEDKRCTATHWQLALGWLVWEFRVMWST